MDLQERSGPSAVAGMEQDVLTAVREHATRTAMMTLNREDPTTVNRTLLDRKGAREEAVAGHSSF